MANLNFSALASVQIPNLAPMLNISAIMSFATANSSVPVRAR